MNSIYKLIFLGLLLVTNVIVASCSTEVIKIDEGVQSFDFQIFYPENLGVESELIPAEANKIIFIAQAMGKKGKDPFKFNGNVSLYLNFGGKSVFIKTISFVDGSSEKETVELSNVYGKARLMIVDDLGENPSYATGVSDEIYFRNPTLSDIQKSSAEKPPFSSDMVGYRVNIRGQKWNIGRMVVTAVTNSGFFVTDLETGNLPYASLFVYNFSRPYGVYRYQMLCQLTGGVQEHLGNTQIVFPDWITYDDCKTTDSVLCKICVDALKQYEKKNIIEPYKIKTETSYDKRLMESLESSLVEIENATIMNMFESDYDRRTYRDYGQYKIRLNDTAASATFFVITRDNVSDFDPTKYVGKNFLYVRGILTELNFGSENSMWVVNVRDKYDICIEDFCPRKN